jgi:hypothetical protein
MISIIDAMTDEECFGRWFQGQGDSWAAWKAILKAAFALPMTPQELVTFGELSGGRSPPKKRVRELWVCAGRRAGKDSIASLVATFAAAIEQAHLGRLRPGEMAVVQCLAVDRDQARIVLSYIKAFFDTIPDLGAMIVRETRYGLELNNGVSIEVTTNNFRQARGRTVLLAILDEVSFYRSEDSATPDFEVYRAVVPSLATLPDSMLIAISSPYRKAGLLYEKWKAHFGKDSADVLVIQASSAQLNPTLDPAIVARALEDDPADARSAWLGLFRDDIGSYVPTELIESAVDVGVLVRPPKPGVAYSGFVDAASGVGQDSFALGIAHKDGQEVVLDCAYEIKPPFSPDSALAQSASLLKSYGLHSVVGDKYSAGFVIEGFAKLGVTYTYSERDRSAIYVECLPLFTSGRARLVDNRKLVTQFASLERRTSSVGRDRVDHGRVGHDDLCNAAAGALGLASGIGGPPPLNISEETLAYARSLRPWRNEFSY